MTQGNTALHYAVSAGANDADLVDALLRVRLHQTNSTDTSSQIIANP